MQRRRRLSSSLFVTLFALLGCAAEPAPDPETAPITPVARKGGLKDADSSEASMNQMLVAKVPGGALGPRLIATEGGDVVVWAVVDGPEAGLYSTSVHDGEASEPLRVAPVDPSARGLQVGRDKSGELVVTLVHRVGDSDVLSATRLGPQGEIRGEAIVVASTPEQVLYSRVVPSARGAVVVWVERAGRSADLYSAALEDQGAGRPARLVRGISAWQVSPGPGALTVVTREGGRSGTMTLRQLGDSGQVIGAPIELARDVVGGADLDVVATSDHMLIAWSEKGPHESALVGTLLDSSGNVVATPAPLTRPRGEQALLRLVSAEGSGQIYALWEEPRHTAQGRPFVFLGGVDATSHQATPAVEFRLARRDPLLPAFASEGRDLHFLSDVDGKELSRIAGVIPGDGTPIRSETVALASDEPAVMAWDLVCAEGRCRYLSASGGSPTSVYLAEVAPAAPSKQVHRTKRALPRVVEHVTLGDIPEPAKLTATSSSSGDLLAWVSYFDPDQPYVVPTQPAPDGRRAPVRARLTTVAVGASETGTTVEETVVSYRARSLGGVSLVAPEDNRGLVAWAALDNKKPQVFATLIDGRGKKVRQKMLTRSAGEVTDVTATRVPGGYLLAWVDGRDGRSEVYGVRLSDALVPVGKPRRISQGAQAPSGVTLLAREGRVHCIWADARATGGAGNAVLYGLELDEKTAEPQGAERSLTDPSEHSHTPQLFVGPGEIPWFVWSAEPPSENSAGQSSQLRFGRFSNSGEVLSLSWELPGKASGVTVECEVGVCSAAAIVSRSSDQGVAQVALHGARLYQGEKRAELEGSLLLPLWTGTPEGVSPVVQGNSVYFADQESTRSSWKLRRARIQWAD